MRELLFRGKRLDNGEWIEWAFCPKNSKGDIHCIIVDNDTMAGFFFEVDPATIGKYTGLKDKNGKRIFEGDILEGRDFDEEDGYGVVEWDDGALEVISEGNWIGTFHDNYNSFDLEIIGNIHDNPELLKGGEGDG